MLIVIAFLWLSLAACKQNVTSGNQEVPAATATAPVRVSPDNADAAEPAIASDTEGNIYTLFVEHKPDKSADLYLQKFDAKLKRVGDQTRINPKPGSAKAWRGDPPTIAIGSDKAVYVGWTRKYDDEKAKGNDLVLSVSRDGGASFAEPIKVNDDNKPASHGMHSLAVDKDNRVYMSWLDERNVAVKPHVMASMPAMHHEEKEPNSEVFYAVSGDGGKTFSANKMIAKEACPCCKTSMLAATGAVYASWRQVLPGDFRHVAVARTTDAGATFSAGVIVGEDNWQINACPVSGAALSGDAEKINVVWYTAGTAGKAGVYSATSTDGGRSFAPRILIDPEATSVTPVLPGSESGGTFLVYSLAVGNIVVAESQQIGGYAVRRTIEQSTLPAAAISGGRPVTLFVKTSGTTRAVWLDQ